MSRYLFPFGPLFFKTYEKVVPERHWKEGHQMPLAVVSILSHLALYGAVGWLIFL